MKANNKTGLFWFRHDCRLHDMPALQQLSQQVDSLLCVYVVNPKWFTVNQWGCKPIGEKRWRFILEGLYDLEQRLSEMGDQQLIVIEGDEVQTIKLLCEQYQVSTVALHAHCGTDEANQRVQLQQSLPDVHFIVEDGTTLYRQDALPFSLENMPDTFSPFRRKVEKYSKAEGVSNAIAALPPCPISELKWPDIARQGVRKSVVKTWSGGETSALEQLQYYLFDSNLVANYKVTRNQMLGWDFSSKLSAWLAAGHISPRMVFHALSQYEQQQVKNESTYWLFFELLWREFFHWQLRKHGARFFKYDGIQNKRPNTGYDAERFERWCNGDTGYDIVDACMRELNATGFMSNRGRQLVASCFVHELNLDWRYGAAYFEQQLIDFDVASNYGNWQYLAGVGSDPRGHRQFNLAKQTQQYDANGAFRRQWLT